MVCFVSKAHWLDPKIGELQIVWRCDQLLRVDSDEFWGKPVLEKLFVGGLEPFIVLVLIHLLKGHDDGIRLDLRQVEEMLVYLLEGVGVWATEVICFTRRLFSLDAIVDGEGNIVRHNWLELAVHALNCEVHTVEHFQLHAPPSSDGRSWIDIIEHVGWSQNRHIWECFLDLLLTDPLGSEASGLRVGISTSSRNMNQSFHVWISSACLGNGDWDSDVGVLEVRQLGGVHLRSNAVDDGVLGSDNVGQVSLASEILEVHVGLIAEIGGWLNLLECIVPYRVCSSIRINDRRSNGGKFGADGHTKNARGTKDGGIDTRDRVSTSLIVHMESL